MADLRTKPRSEHELDRALESQDIIAMIGRQTTDHQILEQIDEDAYYSYHDFQNEDPNTATHNFYTSLGTNLRWQLDKSLQDDHNPESKELHWRIASPKSLLYESGCLN